MRSRLEKKPLASKPPMGWNSYDSYANNISEDEVMENLEIFAKRLKPFGYRYFVIDLGWYSEYACIPGTRFPSRSAVLDYSLNRYGYPIGCQTYFPNGLKRIADRAHKLGVRFGLHLMRGMLKKAYEFNLPVKHTKYTMRDIGNPNSPCSWHPDTMGVDMTKPGAQEYYDGLIQHMADMGVDFIKYDDLVPYPAEVEAIGKAVAKCKRNIVLSLSPGNETAVDNEQVYKWAHMLRITGDAWDRRSSLADGFTRWREWQGKAVPHFWPDLDMLCIGKLSGMINPAKETYEVKNIPVAELIKNDLDTTFYRDTNFTRAQEETFMTQRAMSASPLFMGGCLKRSKKRAFDMVTNSDMLECNQNGVSGSLVCDELPVEIWKTPGKDNENIGWLGLFNRSEKVVKIKPRLEKMGLADGEYDFFDIWEKKPFVLGGFFSIEPDGVAFLKYSKS